MLQSNNRGEINGGVVALLAATVFIGVVIGGVSFYIAEFVNDNQSSARFAVSEEQTTVNVRIHSIGTYERLHIQFGERRKNVTLADEYVFKKPTDGKITLLIEGITQSGDAEILLKTEIEPASS